MPESLIPTGDVDARRFIADMKYQIDERMAEMCDKVRQIRERAKHDERYEIDRAYAEIEPIRRQMEAMIQSVAGVAALQMPPPTIIAMNK